MNTALKFEKKKLLRAPLEYPKLPNAWHCNFGPIHFVFDYVLTRRSTMYGAEMDPIRAKVEAKPTAKFRTFVGKSSAV